MEANDVGTRVLDLLARQHGFGVAILDAEFRWKWATALATERIDAEPLGRTGFGDRIRAANGVAPDPNDARAVALGTLSFGSLRVSALGAVDSNGNSAWCIEDRARCERAAADVRSTATCADFAHRVRSFHHDIKSPLNALSLQIALQERRKDSSSSRPSDSEREDGRVGLDALLREVKRVDRLIGEFAAPWYAGESEPAAADVRATVAAAIEALEPLARLAAVRCELHAPGEPCVLTIRHDLLHHGMTNLLILAIDHCSVATLPVPIVNETNEVRIALPRAAEYLVNGGSGPEHDSRSVRDVIRRDVALAQFKAAGARVAATERGGLSWYEIEFPRRHDAKAM